MDYAELNQLEKNIKRAIEIIQKLVIENQGLRQENEKLIYQIQINERIIQQLKNETASNIDIEQQSRISQEKEGKIKQKVQQMLEKLETFQQLSSNR